ncbi:MAG: cytochrome c biogenesis CcdA family protein [Flavobacteriaceae bacterium]
MDFSLTYPIAFAAGLLSFVSPCVLPLVPPYLCFIAGVSMDELGARDGRQIAAARLAIFNAALAFVAGFTTVFVLLGASASALGRLIASHLDVLAMVAGIVIIAMGLHFLDVYRFALLNREARVQVREKPAGLLGAWLIGLAFAFGWTPCIGPVLAAILSVAASEDTVARGAALLAVYSLGLGVPFLLAAAFAGAFMRFMARFRRHLGTVEKAMGVLLVVTGILFLTGGMQAMSFWLLENFPGLGDVEGLVIGK